MTQTVCQREVLVEKEPVEKTEMGVWQVAKVEDVVDSLVSFGFTRMLIFNQILQRSPLPTVSWP